MATSDLHQDVKTALKIASEHLDFQRVQLRFGMGVVTLQENGKPVAVFSYEIVSRKFAAFGAAFGMYVQFYMTGGKVIEALRQINLPFLRFDEGTVAQFFSFSSLHHKKERFLQKDGYVSYYQEDNVEEKSREVINKINGLYSREVQRFIDASMDAIDDIFYNMANYGYPRIYIMIICHLNGETHRIPELLAEARKRNVPLVSATNLKKVPEEYHAHINADDVLKQLNVVFRRA